VSNNIIHRQYRAERYHSYDDDIEHARYTEAKESLRKLLVGDSEKFARVYYLRRKKEYREDRAKLKSLYKYELGYTQPILVSKT
jgi:hypothetical protein